VTLVDPVAFCRTACAAIMDPNPSVLNGSCTDCDGSHQANCTSASCAAGYHTFADGVGCTGTRWFA
jgi:hypothetical protein